MKKSNEFLGISSDSKGRIIVKNLPRKIGGKDHFKTGDELGFLVGIKPNISFVDTENKSSNIKCIIYLIRSEILQGRDQILKSLINKMDMFNDDDLSTREFDFLSSLSPHINKVDSQYRIIIPERIRKITEKYYSKEFVNMRFIIQPIVPPSLFSTTPGVILVPQLTIEDLSGSIIQISSKIKRLLAKIALSAYKKKIE